jgi:hypothetical protein
MYREVFPKLEISSSGSTNTKGLSSSPTDITLFIDNTIRNKVVEFMEKQENIDLVRVLYTNSHIGLVAYFTKTPYTKFYYAPLYGELRCVKNASIQLARDGGSVEVKNGNAIIFEIKVQPLANIIVKSHLNKKPAKYFGIKKNIQK